MVNLTIDGRQISVEENTTIMEAARSVGIQIPSLCYLKDINEIGACRVCVVELEGKDRLITACNNICEEGMVIYTNSPKVRKDRRTTVELILSEHDCQCVTCMRSGNCSLQKIANDLDILELPFHQYLEHQPWDKTFPLIRDSAKCIKCMRCVQVCDKVQGLGVWDVEGTGYHTTVNVSGHNSIREADCALCGQCITHCPVGALRERSDTNEVWKAIEDPDKIVVAQVAPAVRAAWGEELGLAPEDATVGKIIDALKRMGINYVFDTTFSADLTIMEEGSELLSRILKGTGPLPQFTSCCPAWVKYMENFHPDKTAHLSSAKSPIGMQGAVIKTYFAHKKHIDPEKIISVAVTPCTAKKAEIAREELCDAGKLLNIEEMRDNDYVITTKELVQWCQEEGLDLDKITPSKFDSVLGEGTGAGMIFGNTGGVMEAALRTVYRVLEGKEAPADFYQLRPVRGLSNRKEAEVTIAGKKLRVCILYGTAAAEKFLAEDMNGYHFVEVMTCPGGCISGAGQPDCGSVPVSDVVRKKRIQSLYQADEQAERRNSMDNPEIGTIYHEFFKEPLSMLSEKLLHTTYKRK